LVYNCRCTLIANLVGFEHDMRDPNFRPGLEGTDYDEWKNERKSKRR